MAISSTINGWSADADVPTDDEGMWYLRYQVALAGINLEREVLRLAHYSGNPSVPPSMSDEEYDTRTAILDDLESQYKGLFEANVPIIQWSEV